MNLTTKEMATLMNVSLRGVEASRYRLRKKLNLASEVNLTEFFVFHGILKSFSKKITNHSKIIAERAIDG